MICDRVNMGRLDFNVDRYAYDPADKKLNRFRSPYKPEGEMQLLDGKFASSTEKKDSYGNIDHRGSKIVSPKHRFNGNSSTFNQESQDGMMDSFGSTINLNDSYGSNRSFPRVNSRKDTPEYNTGKSNRKYTVDGREISFQEDQTTKKESNGMKDEVDRNSQDDTYHNKKPTLVYNSEASRFEESTLNFHGPDRSRARTPQNRLLSSKSSHDQIDRPVSNRNSIQRSVTPVRFRPEPSFSFGSSNLKPSGGIEFNESEAREKFQQIMKASNNERQRSQKVEALKQSTIPTNKGIEEESSEYGKRYYDYNTPEVLNNLPDWYFAPLKKTSLDFDEENGQSTAKQKTSSTFSNLDERHPAPNKSSITSNASRDDPILSVQQSNTFRQAKYSYF